MLLSLLEGYDVEATLKRMAGGLAFEDLRNRMLNVFGKFIQKLGMFPGTEDEWDIPLDKISENNNLYCLRKLSL